MPAMSDEKHEELKDLIRAGYERLSNQMLDLGARLRKVEDWKEEAEARMRTNSLRAQAPSSHDIETASALAEEVKAREALDKKVDELLDIARDLRKVAANPMVRRVAYAVGSAILFWLASKGYLHQ